MPLPFKGLTFCDDEECRRCRIDAGFGCWGRAKVRRHQSARLPRRVGSSQESRTSLAPWRTTRTPTSRGGDATTTTPGRARPRLRRRATRWLRRQRRSSQRPERGRGRCGRPGRYLVGRRRTCRRMISPAPCRPSITWFWRNRCDCRRWLVWSDPKTQPRRHENALTRYLIVAIAISNSPDYLNRDLLVLYYNNNHYNNLIYEALLYRGTSAYFSLNFVILY